MKHKTILFTFLLLLLSAAAVFADDFSPEFIQLQESILRSIDQYFPRLLITETFDIEEKPDLTDSPEVGVDQYNRVTHAGKYEAFISAWKPVSDTKRNETWLHKADLYSDFYFSIEGQILERDDSEKGSIYFGYTSVYSEDSGNSYCEVDFPISIIRGKRFGEMRDEQIMADLTQYRADYDNHRFEIIRLDGYTSVFIDRRLVAGFADGFSGKFYFFWGAGLFPGGKYAGGQFDNVLIRVK